VLPSTAISNYAIIGALCDQMYDNPN